MLAVFLLVMKMDSFVAVNTAYITRLDMLTLLLQTTVTEDNDALLPAARVIAWSLHILSC